MSRKETNKLKETLLVKAESMRLNDFRIKAEEEIKAGKELPTFPITIGGEVIHLSQEEIIMYDMFISHIMLLRKSEETDKFMSKMLSEVSTPDFMEDFVEFLKKEAEAMQKDTGKKEAEPKEDKTTLKSNVSKEREKSSTGVNIIIDKLGQEQ